MRICTGFVIVVLWMMIDARVIANQSAIILSPTLGRPAVVAPGERLSVRIAGVDGQSVSEVRLISPQTPMFAQPLILPSGKQSIVDSIQSLQIVVPRTTPTQIYDLELTVLGRKLISRHAVVVRATNQPSLRIAHIAQLNIDPNGVISLTDEMLSELNRWNVDLIAISAVRLDNAPRVWKQLTKTIASSQAPLLLAPGEGVDLNAFGTHVTPSLTSRLELGKLRIVAAVSTFERPLSSDAEQLAWLREWSQAKTDIAPYLAVVMDHGVPINVEEHAPEPWVLASDGQHSNAAYRIIDFEPTRATNDTPVQNLYDFGTLLAEITPAEDLAPHAVQLVLRNRSAHAITNATQRIVLNGGEQPWCLGGRLTQVIQVDERIIVDWSGDIPARGVVSAIIGTGEKPTLPSISAAFDTPYQLTPRRAARGAWGTISLRNTSNTSARVRPLVMLNERHVAYRLNGLAEEGSGNFRFHLAAGEEVELELLTLPDQLTTGSYDLQLYLTQLPVWETLSHPITLAAD